ncbi:hypothetical protein [Sunxiuqinia elliptica]|uniref:Uncharacterized protein n=1 Tax=Sunxiuqinia elliptica TaxID=655355 RepID=A0A4V3BXE8_9BACT|nr:hypothetical protein [Sunxiuqinia elliptica]TDN98308.1 hypothetical protein DET52_10895 [Sunxiuqinia elliptica]TDO60414.1 hypothetical protein DET65_2218 [Sunxiuqinia elliptica]
MKKLLILSVLLGFVFYASSQNNTSVSLNYQYLHETGSHGIGAGFKTRIWKDFALLSDVNYFFKKYHGTFEDNFEKEYYSRYASLNLNIGYNLSLSENISLLPYAGLGIFYENINGYISSQGKNLSGVGAPSDIGAPYHVSIDDNLTAPLGNIGFLIEYYLSDQIFLTGGAKYQVDLYDGTYSSFPNLTVGIGYKL